MVDGVPRRVRPAHGATEPRSRGPATARGRRTAPSRQRPSGGRRNAGIHRPRVPSATVLPSTTGPDAARVRDGHRQADSALYRTVIVRLHLDKPTIDHVAARRNAEGNAEGAIIRCLKRYVAREVRGYIQPERCPMPELTGSRARDLQRWPTASSRPSEPSSSTAPACRCRPRRAPRWVEWIEVFSRPDPSPERDRLSIPSRLRGARSFESGRRGRVTHRRPRSRGKTRCDARGRLFLLRGGPGMQVAPRSRPAATEDGRWPAVRSTPWNGCDCWRTI